MTRVKFVVVFIGNLKVNLQTLEVLVFRKTIRDVSLPKLTLLDDTRGHFLWRHLFYPHLLFVCLFSGGAGGATQPTASLSAVKIPFLTITEKIPLWNYFCFKLWGVNYFSWIQSFLECLYPAFILHNANLCFRTHGFIDLAYKISLCFLPHKGLWNSGALGWEAGSQCPPAGALALSSAAAPGWEVLLSPLSPWHKHKATCLTPEPNQTPWQSWVLQGTPCSPPLEGRAQRE